MSASWNNKDRRIAKQLAKTGWYKTPVEPPASNQAEVNKENKTTMVGDETYSNQKEGYEDQPSNSQEESKKSNIKKSKPQKAKKRRGENRDSITLEGQQAKENQRE